MRSDRLNQDIGELLSCWPLLQVDDVGKRQHGHISNSTSQPKCSKSTNNNDILVGDTRQKATGTFSKNIPIDRWSYCNNGRTKQVDMSLFMPLTPDSQQRSLHCLGDTS